MSSVILEENGSRKTLHKVIKSFLVIFCTYYLVTHIWPMIKRKIALRKEKSAIMARLLRKQENISVEIVDDVSSKSSSDNKSDVVFSNDQFQKRFDLGHTLKKPNTSDKYEVDAGEDPPTASLVDETLGIVGSKYNSEGSNRSALSGRYVMKPTKQLIKTVDKLEDVILIEGKMSGKKLEEAEDATTEMHVTDGGDLDQKTTVQKLTNNELLPKKNSEGHKNLTKLWRHISRTAPYSTYTTYANNSVDINPWDNRNIPRGISTEEDSSAIGNIHSQNLQSARLTYSEARELRNQQDAEYSSSLAQEELKKRIAKELLDVEVSNVISKNEGNIA